MAGARVAAARATAKVLHGHGDVKVPAAGLFRSSQERYKRRRQSNGSAS